MAFYCRQYAMEKGLEIKQKDTTGQVRAQEPREKDNTTYVRTKGVEAAFVEN